MARITVNLNKSATAAFGTAPKVRVKIEDGVVYVRPTDRTKGLANLPKGETLRAVSSKGSTSKFSLNAEGLEAGKTMILEAAKYGWYILREGVVNDMLTPVARFSKS